MRIRKTIIESLKLIEQTKYWDNSRNRCRELRRPRIQQDVNRKIRDCRNKRRFSFFGAIVNRTYKLCLRDDVLFLKEKSVWIYSVSVRW